MEMRERIARAIGEGLDVVDPRVGDVVEEQDLFAAADAVLAAMREPTEEMVDAAKTERMSIPPDTLPGSFFRRMYTAAIDAASRPA